MSLVLSYLLFSESVTVFLLEKENPTRYGVGCCLNRNCGSLPKTRDYVSFYQFAWLVEVVVDDGIGRDTE